MTLQQVLALFVLAEIDVQRTWKLPNGYLGEQEPLTDEDIVNDNLPSQPGVVVREGTVSMPGMTVLGLSKQRQTSGVVRDWMADYRWRYHRPAWLIKTPFGLIKITERKRVIELSWEDTNIRTIITTDDTTKDYDGACVV